jgi:polyhydroxyalkanoate synthesis regulator phasin
LQVKKVIFAIMFLTILIATMSTSYADRGDWHGGIRSRIEEAQQRIEQGIERGSLTRHEARKLHEELANILEIIDKMKQDGRLDDREREEVNRNLDRLDRDISSEKHDDEMVTGNADRGDWHGGIRSRIEEAQQRIEQGIERGSLTRHEARRLHEELANILERIDRMKQDGRLDNREREVINRDLDRLERDISREKRDSEGRRY